jgi:inhibitor of cysteine peptidase
LILNGNPSTGYTWDVGFYVHPVIEPTGEPEYQSDSNLVGAGGTYTFRFLATGEGEAKLAMTYHRPLDKDAPIFKTCEVTVTVK